MMRPNNHVISASTASSARLHWGRPPSLANKQPTSSASDSEVNPRPAQTFANHLPRGRHAEELEDQSFYHNQEGDTDTSRGNRNSTMAATSAIRSRRSRKMGNESHSIPSSRPLSMVTSEYTFRESDREFVPSGGETSHSATRHRSSRSAQQHYSRQAQAPPPTVHSSSSQHRLHQGSSHSKQSGTGADLSSTAVSNVMNGLNMSEYRVVASERSGRLATGMGSGHWSVGNSCSSLNQIPPVNANHLEDDGVDRLLGGAPSGSNNPHSSSRHNNPTKGDNPGHHNKYNTHGGPYTPTEDVNGVPGVDGMLVLRVLVGTGLHSSRAVLRDLYCVVEVDGIRKARTMIRTNTENFEWDEMFELDLESAVYLSLLLYQWDPRSRHRLCFYGNVNLYRVYLQLLRLQLNHDKIALKLEPRGILFVELDFLEPEQVYSRYPASHPNAVFGAPLHTVIVRENTLFRVPLVLQRCVDEVDKRGLQVVGIYRLNASVKLKSHIRDMFERNAAEVDLDPSVVPDIHAISGVLKDYLRELPEPLFTNALYRMLVDAIMVNAEQPPPSPNNPHSSSLRIPGANLMLNILECLPPANQDTLLFLLDHLKRVARKAEYNKMSEENLALCFGPILLCPAPSSLRHLDPSYFSLRTQVDILRFILEIWPEGAPLQAIGTSHNSRTGASATHASRSGGGHQSSSTNLVQNANRTSQYYGSNMMGSAYAVPDVGQTTGSRSMTSSHRNPRMPSNSNHYHQQVYIPAPQFYPAPGRPMAQSAPSRTPFMYPDGAPMHHAVPMMAPGPPPSSRMDSTMLRYPPGTVVVDYMPPSLPSSAFPAQASMDPGLATLYQPIQMAPMTPQQHHLRSSSMSRAAHSHYGPPPQHPSVAFQRSVTLGPPPSADPRFQQRRGDQVPPRDRNFG